MTLLTTGAAGMLIIAVILLLKARKRAGKREEFVLHIDRAGTIRALHSDAIPFQKLGDKITRVRASHIEPDDAVGDWVVWDAEMKEILHRNPSRQECLDWERETFNKNLPV